MPRGLFYPTYRMRSLSFRGTGKVDYTSLGNYTSEPVTFQWFVPDAWGDKVGWELDGKTEHKLEVPPNSPLRKTSFAVGIDPEIKELQHFLPTLLVAHGPSRFEW